jgi:hypothetical protein
MLKRIPALKRKIERILEIPTLMHHECKGSNILAKKAKHDAV